ncbi:MULTISPECIES: HugZ family protein [unclassified Paenibacillus]|uniref:HugZ family pyridoxamine 5'-phosphate oxidase n=1 Tax=unclassified Paenibacillus TaxID=185978 RepID=UPI0008399581|nr:MULTISPECIES: pyridoxamine 5'-phosphate oxidase family protein [unclassified Paenibacillus]NWL88734.1 heme iron utilization protein [Paenibacillus sp. 79R4]
MNVLDIASIKNQYLEFSNSLKTVMMSTIDEQGKPFVSYAPFVKHNGKLYVYLSRVANHYDHLENNPLVDVMLIEDEGNTANLFARQRARFECTTQNVGNDGYEEVFELFSETFNKKMFGMLRTLDFSLFEITPRNGRYVVGFGLAFDIDLMGDRFEHVARDGHEQNEKTTQAT